MPKTTVHLALVSLIGVGALTSSGAQEPEERATASVAGITATVVADRWSGTPPQLTEVIPLLVTIDNRSARPLRLRYEAFALVAAPERWLAALPPFAIDATETVAVRAPYPYPYDGFYVAPHLVRYYPFFARFDGAFAYDPFFYATYYPAFRRVSLPTGDMVQKALPEGVLQAGGRITGFLYFEAADFARDRGTFLFDLVDARTLRRLGRIEMPLEID
jgi:hypothetical protein